jgi:hypothetical protein
MGSIEQNVKNPEAWQNGRNAGYARDLDHKMADLDVRNLADRAINDAKPGLGERLREGTQRLAHSLRTDQEKRREAWEVFGETISRHYLVVREGENRVGLYEPASKVPAITIDKHKISTSHESGAAIADSVKLAVDRGWTSLKVEGTAAYKDAVWLEAKKYDLKVGHAPSPLIRAEFERWRETNDIRTAPAAPTVQQRPTQPPAVAPEEPKRNLGEAFLKMTAEQRLADPQLRNAELSARAARDLAAQRFGANDPKLKIAYASVDKMVSDQLSRSHQFSTPKVVQQIRSSPSTKPDNKQQFDRPRI